MLHIHGLAIRSGIMDHDHDHDHYEDKDHVTNEEVFRRISKQ